MTQGLPSTSSAGSTSSTTSSETVQPGIDNALASVVKVYVDSLIKDKSRLSILLLHISSSLKIHLSFYSHKRVYEEDSLPLKNFQTFGRMYGRQADPFVKVDAIVNFGLKHETTEETDENLEEQQELQPQ